MLGFGAGAFYVGKIGYAVAQLICYLILFPLCFIVQFNDSWGVIIPFLVVSFTTIGLFIVGVINTQKWTFEYNYKKFSENIASL